MIDTTRIILAHISWEDDIVVQFVLYAILISIALKSFAWLFAIFEKEED